jgi:hypothetical protein
MDLDCIPKIYHICTLQLMNTMCEIQGLIQLEQHFGVQLCMIVKHGFFWTGSQSGDHP